MEKIDWGAVFLYSIADGVVGGAVSSDSYRTATGIKNAITATSKAKATGGKANYAFVGMTADGTSITTFGIRSISELAKVIPWLIK